MDGRRAIERVPATGVIAQGEIAPRVSAPAGRIDIGTAGKFASKPQVPSDPDIESGSQDAESNLPYGRYQGTLAGEVKPWPSGD